MQAVNQDKEYLVFPVQDNKYFIWEFDMEKVNGTFVYWLGASLGSLFYALNNSPSTGAIANIAPGIISNINYFLNQSQSLPLSRGAVAQIKMNIDGILANKKSLDIPLTSDEIGNTVISIINFQSIFNAELPTLNIFSISQHRGYDMTTLIKEGEKLLSANTINSLSVSKDEVIREIREASRCLAFGTATAVGLHLSRAVESIVVNEYFPSLKITIGKNQNLGAYIKQLEETVKVDSKVISKLRDFKDYYRNMITHPEEFWDIDQADSAFGTAINVIDAMAKDIEEIKKKP